MAERYMTSREVASVLKISTATLCRLRQTGQGPPVVWLTDNCPRYRWSDVEAWAAARTRAA